MIVTITEIKRTPRTSKRTGKSFVSLGIKCQEYGDKWLSGFANNDNADWAVGDRVSIDVEPKGEYINFSMPKGTRDASPAASNGATAEIKNLLTLQVIPMLQAIHKENIAISERLKMDSGEDDFPMPEF